MSQSDKARAFAALHVEGDPVVLFNCWDPGSAQAVAASGAKALATGSASVAGAFGAPDGEGLALDLVLENLARIAAATDLPVSLDFEGGYAADPAPLAENFSRALEAGAIGINFEDQVVGTSDLYDVETQCARIRALRTAAEAAGIPAFINARTDLFLKSGPAEHAGHMPAAIERAAAYADAGASGFFAPKLGDEGLIGQLCEAVDLPVNILAFPGFPSRARLAELGVARISHGPFPWRNMLKWLEAEARAALA